MFKKQMTKILSVLLALTMIISVVSVSAMADGNFSKLDDYVSENFYEGSGFEYDTAPEGAVWSLGSAAESIVPLDYEEKDYYTGGYWDFDIFLNGNGIKKLFTDNEFRSDYFAAIKRVVTNRFVCKVKQVLDDVKVRAVVIDDGTGRGATAFATIDAIGVSNKIIRDTRALVEEKFEEENVFSSINIFSTHTHSGVDTQGLWTNFFVKLINNLKVKLISLINEFLIVDIEVGELEEGTDPKYVAFMSEKVAQAIENAYEDMETGTMTYAKKSIEGYIYNKNLQKSSALMDDMNRLVFTPDNEDSAPTMIVNMSAHPFFAGLPTYDGKGDGDGLSGDYVYYMGEIINEAGFDFMFFNGAIAGIYTADKDKAPVEHRVEKAMYCGRELGKIALAMTMTEEEIENNPLLKEEVIVTDDTASEEDKEPVFWHTDWEPVTETELEPLLNVRIKEIKIKVTNIVIQLVGKMNFVSYNILEDGLFGYYIPTEVGYMELGGGAVKIAMLPGEICQDIIVGGISLDAETSTSGKDYGYPTIQEIFCEEGEEIVAFGLANDAIGYVIPDSSYGLAYHELISLGKKTASTITKAFMEIAEEIK